MVSLSVSTFIHKCYMICCFFVSVVLSSEQHEQMFRNVIAIELRSFYPDNICITPEIGHEKSCSESHVAYDHEHIPMLNQPIIMDIKVNLDFASEDSILRKKLVENPHVYHLCVQYLGESPLCKPLLGQWTLPQIANIANGRVLIVSAWIEGPETIYSSVYSGLFFTPNPIPSRYALTSTACIVRGMPPGDGTITDSTKTPFKNPLLLEQSHIGWMEKSSFYKTLSILEPQYPTTQMVGEFHGRSSNVLHAFINALYNVSRSSPTTTGGVPSVLIIPQKVLQYFPRDEFDYESFASSHIAMIKDDIPSSSHIETITHQSNITFHDAFYSTSVPHIFHQNAITQFILNPLPKLRILVDTFIQENHLEEGYVAIHLRSLDSECEIRYDSCRRIPSRIGGHDMDGMTAHDVCTCSDNYLKALFRKDNIPGKWPIVLCHDHKESHLDINNRAEAIMLKYNAVSYQGPSAVNVDMLLLVRSSYLVGNPMSTMSIISQSVRVAAGAQTNSSNIDMDIGRYGTVNSEL